MQDIFVRVLDYYGSSKYYPFMPPQVFDALEAAYLKDSEFAFVSACLLEQMLADYSAKTSA